MKNLTQNARFSDKQLFEFVSQLFQVLSLPKQKANVVARILVEADLLGHVTHGLQLCPSYLKELEAGTMEASGEHEVIKDSGVVAVWDGRYLPGCWLTQLAVEDAIEKAKTFGTGIIVIRRSHHIGCLASYLEAPARAGYLVEISCVDPSMATVPAYGGLNAVFTPDPIAVGIPTETDPIMIDLSASTTAMGTAALYRARGERLPGKWLQDRDGNVTDDPNVLVGDNPGTILPSGGIDHGHKGFALALILETFTQGLSGLGRVDAPTNWGAATQVRATDPNFFCGVDEFRRQSQWIADICKDSLPRKSEDSVRLPGQNGLQQKRKNLNNGVPLSPEIIEGLETWSKKLGVPFIGTND